MEKVMVVFGDKKKVFNVTYELTFGYLLNHCCSYSENTDSAGFELVSCQGIAYELDILITSISSCSPLSGEIISLTMQRKKEKRKHIEDSALSPLSNKRRKIIIKI